MKPRHLNHQNLKLTQLWEKIEFEPIKIKRIEKVIAVNPRPAVSKSVIHREEDSSDGGPSEYSTPLNSPLATCDGVFWFPCPPDTPPGDLSETTPSPTSPACSVSGQNKVRVSRKGSLVDDLLNDIYFKLNKYQESRIRSRTGSTSSSLASPPGTPYVLSRPLRTVQLRSKGMSYIMYIDIYVRGQPYE